MALPLSEVVPAGWIYRDCHPDFRVAVRVARKSLVSNPTEFYIY